MSLSQSEPELPGKNNSFIRMSYWPDKLIPRVKYAKSHIVQNEQSQPGHMLAAFGEVEVAA